MSQETIRIKDIALRANVSVGTVDRVLHNRGRVADDVKQRVLQIAQELNYQPNVMARTLGTNRTYRLAALLPAADLDPYWQEPVKGIDAAERELRQFGIRVDYYFFDQHNPASFPEQTRILMQNPPDGVLVAPIFYRESLEAFAQWQQQEIPFVLFNTHITEAAPLSYVGQDSYQSGLLAGKLLHYGLTGPASFLVAHIAEDFANSPHLILKEQGFRDYFDQKGLSDSVRIVHADLAETALDRQLDALFDTQPNLKGIFVTTSKAYLLAPYLLNAEANIRLVGYDLLTRNLDFLQQEVIDFIINQNPHGQGYRGIVCLTDHLVFKRPVMPITYLPLDIITRENVAFYR